MPEWSYSLIKQALWALVGVSLALVTLFLLNERSQWITKEKIEFYRNTDTNLYYDELEFYIPEFEDFRSYFALYTKLLEAGRGLYAERVMQAVRSKAKQQGDFETQAAAMAYLFSLKKVDGLTRVRDLLQETGYDFTRKQTFMDFVQPLQEQGHLALAGQVLALWMNFAFDSKKVCGLADNVRELLKTWSPDKHYRYQLIPTDYIEDTSWIDNAELVARCAQREALNWGKLPLNLEPSGDDHRYRKDIKAMREPPRIECSQECEREWKKINYLEFSREDKVVNHE